MGARLLPIICAVLAAVLLLGLLSFAGPCVHADGSSATCAGASHAIVACAAVGLACLIAAAVLAVRRARVAGILAAVAALAGLAVAILPGSLLPLCMMHSMRCWTLMRPFSLVCGVLLAVLAGIAAIRAFKSPETTGR